MGRWRTFGLKSMALATVFGLMAAVGGPAGPARGADTVTLPQAIRDWMATDLTANSWGPRAVNAPAAHQAGYDGAGVTVAVIDTGVDAKHPDLQGQLLAGLRYETSKDGKTFVAVPVKAGAHTDEEGHGTHVSGIIAARDDGKGITGVAPGAKILPISVLNSKANYADDVTAILALIDAVESAAERGARVINMSLGGAVIEPSGSSSDKETKAVMAAEKRLCDAIAKVRQQYGVVTVISSGNEGPDGQSSIPATCQAAVSVASVASDLKASWFSSFDEDVDVAAPGSGVLSTVPEGYQTWDGTSMASPHVAAVAALLFDQNPKATADEVISALEESALDVGRTGFDVSTGHGVVDAAAALRIAAPRAQPQESFGSRWRFAVNAATEAMVIWNYPMTDEVVGYTTYDLDTDTGKITQADLPPSAVRAATPVALDGSHWVRAVADLQSGAILDGGWIHLPSLQAPPAITGLKAKVVKRTAKVFRVQFTWNLPKKPRLYTSGELSFSDVDGSFYDSQTVNLASGRAVLTLPRPARDTDLSFTLGAQASNDSGEFVASNTVVVRSPSIGYLVSAEGVGRKLNVVFVSNPSANAAVRPKAGKAFTVQVRKAGTKRPAATFTGTMKTATVSIGKNDLVYASMRTRVRLPVSVLAAPEFRVGVKTKGKRHWSPWRPYH